MNALFNQIKSCYWQNKLNEAYQLAEKLFAEIDIDDDDDVSDLVSMIENSVCEYKHYDILNLCVKHNFDINTKLAKSDCLILKAANNCVEPEIFQALIDMGADAYSENSDGENALILAAKRTFNFGFDTSKAEKLPVYIANNLDLSKLNKTDRYGVTPLLYAVELGKNELAKTLISKGVDVNETGSSTVGGCSLWTSYDGVTALAAACRQGNVEMAKYLIENGADESMADCQGLAPIFYLLKYPFGFLQRSMYNNPLFAAKCEIVPLFSNLNVSDESGRTPLILSMSDRETKYINQPITHAIIENHADVTIAANNGCTALHLAADNKFFDTVKLLISNGADVNAKNSNGSTPLQLACLESSEKIARYLIKKGADYNIPDNKGVTAMEIAAERGLVDVLELMA